MRPFQSDLGDRPDIVHAKHVYGLWFGMAFGLAFSLTAWGMDAFWLDRANAILPWLKFVTGTVLCGLVGGLTGWLSARLNRSIWSVLLWLTAAYVFAWLTIWLPFRIMPRLLSILEPELQMFLNYPYYDEFSSRIGLAYLWIAIFAALVGLLQLPLSDSAVFSTSLLGRIIPIVVCFVLIGTSGLIVDGFNNGPLRSAVSTLHETIEFSLDQRGNEIDPAVFRRMHLGALRAIEDFVTPQRKLVVSGYDAIFGEVKVLVRFENADVECEVLYDQPVFCRTLTGLP
ncbi:MAG TPA: hypothetical protein VFO91_05820 [Anaerolineales bacterium]|nr:hypothetical protein [Anaerolineales bacterium]